MSDLNGRYRLAGERVEALRAEAARERLARSLVRAGGDQGRSLTAIVGDLLIRAGRALGGDRRSRRAVAPPTPTGTATVTGGLGRARLSAAPSASTLGLSTARMAGSVRSDRLDRLARDLDGLARELTAGQARKT